MFKTCEEINVIFIEKRLNNIFKTKKEFLEKNNQKYASFKVCLHFNIFFFMLSLSLNSIINCSKNDVIIGF